MYRNSLIAGLTAFLTVGNANAQEPNPCVELAKVIGINYSHYLSVDEQKATAKADMCSQSWSSASSSRRAQISAGYAAFTGSASGSDEEVQQAQSNHCENHFGEYWRNQIRTSEARTVSSEGAAVLTSCLSMTADALNPTLQMANNGQEITMAVQYRPSVQADIHIRLFGPMDLRENTCNVTKQNSTVQVAKPNDVAQVLRPTESITMNCRRTATNTQINGVAYNCTKETIFNIATSGPVKAIKIPRVCSQTIQESRADRIERKADNALQQITAEDAKITGLKSGTNTALTALQSSFDDGGNVGLDLSDSSHDRNHPQTKECPPGQFFTKLETYFEDGHIKIGFFCKKLKQVQVP
jgi:hypothetical protein